MDQTALFYPPGACQKYRELTVDRILLPQGHQIEAGPGVCDGCGALYRILGLDPDKFGHASVFLQTENRLDREPLSAGLFLRVEEARAPETKRMQAKMRDLMTLSFMSSSSASSSPSVADSWGDKKIHRICEWNALITDDASLLSRFSLAPLPELTNTSSPSTLAFVQRELSYCQKHHHLCGGGGSDTGSPMARTGSHPSASTPADLHAYAGTVAYPARLIDVEAFAPSTSAAEAVVGSDSASSAAGGGGSSRWGWGRFAVSPSAAAARSPAAAGNGYGHHHGYRADGDDDVRIVPVHRFPPPYLALSHCWGTVPASSSSRSSSSSSPRTTGCITTKANLRGRMARIPFRSLPQTFQDAVTLARRLGAARYLWIDALCIVQDDGRDWAAEAAKMGDIYAGALLTVAAEHARDGEGGVFNDALAGYGGSASGAGRGRDGGWGGGRSWGVRNSTWAGGGGAGGAGGGAGAGAGAWGAAEDDAEKVRTSKTLLGLDPGRFLHVRGALDAATGRWSTLCVPLRSRAWALSQQSSFSAKSLASSSSLSSATLGSSVFSHAASTPASQQPYRGPLADSVLSTRGWTFQERVLSPRVVHFAASQAFWECRTRWAAEDGFAHPLGSRALDVLGDGGDDRAARTSSSLLPDPWLGARTVTAQGEFLALASADDVRAGRFVHACYKALVQADYSRRAFTRPGDRLVAFAGVARAVRAARSDLGYLAGLWDVELGYGLAWRAVRENPLLLEDGVVDEMGGWDGGGGGGSAAARHARTLALQTTARVRGSPSWSWVSHAFAVAWPADADRDGIDADPAFELQGVEAAAAAALDAGSTKKSGWGGGGAAKTTPGPVADMFGDVAHCRLQVAGVFYHAARLQRSEIPRPGDGTHEMVCDGHELDHRVTRQVWLDYPAGDVDGPVVCLALFDWRPRNVAPPPPPPTTPPVKQKQKKEKGRKTLGLEKSVSPPQQQQQAREWKTTGFKQLLLLREVESLDSRPFYERVGVARVVYTIGDEHTSEWLSQARHMVGVLV